MTGTATCPSVAARELRSRGLPDRVAIRAQTDSFPLPCATRCRIEKARPE